MIKTATSLLAIMGLDRTLTLHGRLNQTGVARWRWELRDAQGVTHDDVRHVAFEKAHAAEGLVCVGTRMDDRMPFVVRYALPALPKPPHKRRAVAPVPRDLGGSGLLAA